MTKCLKAGMKAERLRGPHPKSSTNRQVKRNLKMYLLLERSALQSVIDLDDSKTKVALIRIRPVTVQVQQLMRTAQL